MMQVNFDEKIRNLEGLPLVINEDELTLEFCAITALLSDHVDDARLSGGEKFARYELAQRIHAKKWDTITAEDVTKLKMLIGRAFPPIIVGPAFDLLEGAGKPRQKEYKPCDAYQEEA